MAKKETILRAVQEEEELELKPFQYERPVLSSPVKVNVDVCHSLVLLHHCVLAPQVLFFI